MTVRLRASGCDNANTDYQEASAAGGSAVWIQILFLRWILLHYLKIITAFLPITGSFNNLCTCLTKRREKGDGSGITAAEKFYGLTDDSERKRRENNRFTIYISWHVSPQPLFKMVKSFLNSTLVDPIVWRAVRIPTWKLISVTRIRLIWNWVCELEVLKVLKVFIKGFTC